MPQKLNVKTIEESTVVVTAAFTDEDDSPVTPQSMTWTLTDKGGNVINSRLNVDGGTLDSSMDVVLSDADLAIERDEKDTTRILTVKATYNSTYGAGLTLKDSVEFVIENLVAESS